MLLLFVTIFLITDIKTAPFKHCLEAFLEKEIDRYVSDKAAKQMKSTVTKSQKLLTFLKI